MAVEHQSSKLPPAQPSYVLRGHTSQIHSVRFVRQNSRLLTGDADGWVVYWKLETKRALAVWKAHGGAILELTEWGRDKIITHGRDNSLRVWQLRPTDEATLSTILPTEDAAAERPKPWLLHTLPVNTLNFCAFSMCYEHMSSNIYHNSSSPAKQPSTRPSGSILIATPSTDDKKINVYQLPEEKLKYVVPKVPTSDTGMVMAVKLQHHPASESILVVAGYEAGLTSVHRLPGGASSSVRPAALIYLSQPHAQPILSLDLSLDDKAYFTSSADAIIAAHQMPELPPTPDRLDTWTSQKAMANTGLETDLWPDPGLETVRPAVEPEVSSSTAPSVSSSEYILDSKISKEPTPASTTASLSFAKRSVPSPQTTDAGLSSLLSSAPSQPKIKPQSSHQAAVTIQPPYKINDTRHAGQQSLHVRSDGRILVTGGWDSRIRIYSTKTLKEVAVLKWHKEGVYAVDFAEILEARDLIKDKDVEGTEVAKRETGLGKLQKQREEQMQLKHWVVAGAKDGKVSLWEVF